MATYISKYREKKKPELTIVQSQQERERESLQVAHMQQHAQRHEYGMTFSCVSPFYPLVRAKFYQNTYLASVKGSLGRQNKPTGSTAEVSFDNIVLTQHSASRKGSFERRLVVFFKLGEDRLDYPAMSGLEVVLV